MDEEKTGQSRERMLFLVLLCECCVFVCAAFFLMWLSLGMVNVSPGVRIVCPVLSAAGAVLAMLFGFRKCRKRPDAADVGKFGHIYLACVIVLGIVLPLCLCAQYVLPTYALSLCVVGFTCMGLAQGVCMVCLAIHLGCYVIERSDLLFSICVAAGLAIAWGISLAGVIVSAFASGALLLGGITLLAFLQKTAPDAMKITPGHTVSVVKGRTSIALACQFACAGMLVFTACSLRPWAMTCALAGGFFGIVMQAVAQQASVGGHMNPALVQRAMTTLLLVAVIALNLCCLVGVGDVGLGAAVFLCSFASFMMLVFNWNTLVTEVREFSLEPCPHFVSGLTAVWTGCFAGCAASGVCWVIGLDAGDITPFVAAFDVMAIVLAASAFFCKPDESEGFEAIGEALEISFAPESYEVDDSAVFHRCETLAAEYGLTKRETEVLGYLARGRNAKYIQEELYVSFSTAKTHIYHIYQKFGVNSQQQLMDIVDGRKASPLDCVRRANTNSVVQSD